MNNLLKKLSGGDLRSDGRANEVAEETVKNPQLIDKLFRGLSVSDDVIRARTTHALEKISRTNPEPLREIMPWLIKLAYEDEVPMVKWHLAMIFGNIPNSQKNLDEIISTLIYFLKDKSNFVKSWSISSLAIQGRKNQNKRRKIIVSITLLTNHKSASIRSRARKALKILENESERIPRTWKKAVQK
ncbi:hypothetical protein KAS14_03785 [Candidatus Bathyarchaeota archaeon]|nr:hypothetical protein [Candidatus Bathyarchaeota archaeon]